VAASRLTALMALSAESRSDAEAREAEDRPAKDPDAWS